MPSSGRNVRYILGVEGIGPDDTFYDLGCGDGRVVRAASDLGARAIGVDYNPFLILWARFVSWLVGDDDARFVRGDLFKHSVSDATVIYLYALRGKVEGRLLKKLFRECRPGTRIISYRYPIEGLGRRRTIQCPGILGSKAFVYVI